MSTKIKKVEKKEKYELLEELKEGLRELITLYERIKEENTKLFEENQKLLQINKQKEQEIKNLKEKIETYKLGNAMILTSKGKDISEMKHNAKIRINRMIKEIDRCISLLNK